MSFGQQIRADCEEQASLLEEESPAQGQFRLGKPMVLAVASISACAFVAGWARSGAVSRIAVDGLISEASEADCTGDGDNCQESKCCKNKGSTCFKKNEHWASCNATCTENHKWTGLGWSVVDEKVWDCEELGKSASGCTANGKDCSESKCCSEWGSACFKKNDGWASCNATCNPYYKWENNGWRRKDSKIWDCTVLSGAPCTHDGENCAASKCCLNPYSKCYKKNKNWSSCNRTCTSNWKWVDNRWQEQGKDEKIWACDVLSSGDEEEDDKKGEDRSCHAEAEEKCVGSQGTASVDCRYDARIECCKKAESGRDEKTCCEIEGIPADHKKCGGDGKIDTTCKLEAESRCTGCQGTQCLSCQHDEQIDCCLAKKESCEDCTIGQEGIKKCNECKKDGEKRKACCAKEGIPVGMEICKAQD